MKRLLLGAVFVATVVATAWLVARIPGGLGPVLALAGGIAPATWAAVAAAGAGFYLLDYLRFYTLVRLLGVRLGLGTGVELTCVSYFVSSLTPTADLHLPAMVFILAAPSWSLLGLFGILFILVGRRKKPLIGYAR